MRDYGVNVMLDANSGIAFGLIGIVIGSGLGIFGFLSNVKAKAHSDGVAEGVLQSTLNTVSSKIDKMNTSNEAFQLEHRLEHKELNTRISEVEYYIRVQEDKRKRRTKVEEA